MNPGILDTKIRLQGLRRVRGALGGFHEKWIDIGSVWAQKRELRGSESETGAQKKSETQIQFSIRYASNLQELSAKDQIVEANKVYEILSVLAIPGGRPEMLEIIAKSND